MSATVLTRLHEAQLRVLREEVASWQAAQRDELLARSLEDVVTASLPFADLVRRLRDALGRRLAANGFGGRQQVVEAGQQFLHLVNDTSSYLFTVFQLAQSCAQAGHPVEGVEALRQGIRDVQAIGRAFLADWPWVEAEDIDRALEEQARGECLELDDAMAQVAGMSRDAWLAHVEAVRRSRQLPGARP